MHRVGITVPAAAGPSACPSLDRLTKALSSTTNIRTVDPEEKPVTGTPLKVSKDPT